MIKSKNFKTAKLLTSFVNDNGIKRIDIVGIGNTNLQIATRNELILFYYA